MNPELKLYNNQIFQFCKSVFIKSELMALHTKNLAEKILNYEIVDDYDNPYYINLTGEYSLIDDPIYIILEGKQVILTQQLLNSQPWLRKKYNIYGLSFEQLVKENPNREMFLRCIICQPYKTITEAVNAEDFSLIYYDDSILDIQERHSLVEALKNYIFMFKDRWLIKEYNYEELYPLSLMSVFYSQLPIFLLTKRIDNIKTQYAHTMHIWDYLGSYGLDDYRSILTIDQQLFLYRNIEYIVQNMGKHGTLAILINKLLNQDYLTIEPKMLINTYEYENINNEISITPNIVSRKFNDDPICMFFDKEVMDMEEFYYTLYLNNDISKVDYEKFEEDKEKYSLMNQTTLQTKYLELRRKFPNNPLQNFIMNMIVAGVLHFTYKDIIKFSVPLRIEQYDYNELLSPKLAFLLLSYCLQKQNNIKDPLIPETVKIFPYCCNYNLEDKTIPTINKKISDFINIKEYKKRYEDIYLSGYFYFQEELISTIIKSSFVSLEDVLVGLDNNYELNTAMCKLHDQLFNYNTKTEVDQNVPFFDLPNSSIKDFFFTHSLYSIFNKIESEDSFDYTKITDQIIEYLFPLSLINKYTFNLFSVDKDNYEKLKQLFIQLCSYNIIFIDPQIKNQSTILNSPFLSTIDTMKKLNGIEGVKVVKYQPIPYDDKDETLNTGEITFEAYTRDLNDRLIECKIELSPSPSFSKDLQIFTSKEFFYNKKIGIIPNKLTPGETYYVKIGYRSLLFDSDFLYVSDKYNFNVGNIKNPELNLPELKLASSFIKVEKPELTITDEFIEGEVKSSQFDINVSNVNYLERDSSIATPKLTIIDDSVDGKVKSDTFEIISSLPYDATVISLTAQPMKLTYSHEDKHVESRWIVANDKELKDIVFDSGWINKLTIFNLLYKTNSHDNYYYAVQFKGKRFGISNYSNVYGFNAKGIRRPSIIKVTGVYEPTKISLLKITSDKLMTMGGISDLHIASKWSVYADYSLTKCLYTSDWIEDIEEHNTGYFKTDKVVTYDIKTPKLEILNEYLIEEDNIESDEFSYLSETEIIKPDSVFVTVQFRGKELGDSTVSEPYEVMKSITKRGNLRVILTKEDI